MVILEKESESLSTAELRTSVHDDLHSELVSEKQTGILHI